MQTECDVKTRGFSEKISPLSHRSAHINGIRLSKNKTRASILWVSIKFFRSHALLDMFFSFEISDSYNHLQN